MPYNTPEDNSYTEPEVPPVKRVGWSPEAAKSYTAKVSRASGGITPEEKAKIEDELINSGKSSDLDQLKDNFVSAVRNVRADVAARSVPELGVETASANYKAAMEDDIDSEEAMEDAAVTATIAAKDEDADQWAPGTFEKMLEGERDIRAEYVNVRSETEPWSESMIENVVNVAGAFLATGTEANSWRKLANILDDKYGTDHSLGLGTFVAQGEVSSSVRDWFHDLPSDSQIGVLKHIQEASGEFAGYFGGNEFIAHTMISDVVEKAEGGYLEGDFDMTRTINNVFSLVEFVGVVSSGVKTVKKAKQIKDMRSAAATLERTNKKEAAELEARALDGDEEAEAILGTTREEIIADNNLPKWATYEDSPHISDEFFETQRERVAAVKRRNSEMNLHLADEEKAFQAEKVGEILAGTKRGTLWGNASKFEAGDDGIKVTARFGKDAEVGFKTQEEATAFLKWMKQRNPEMKGSLTIKTYAGKTAKISEDVATGTNPPNLLKLRAKLLEEAGGVPRGGTKAGKAAGKAYRKDKRELSFVEKAIAHLKGEKVDDATAIKMAEDTLGVETTGNKQLSKTAVKKAIKQLQDEAAAITGRMRAVDGGEAAQEAAKEAKANLDRFDQGHYDKLTGEAKRLYDEAVAEGTPTVSKPSNTQVEPLEEGLDEFFVDLDYETPYRSDSSFFDFDMDKIIWRGTFANYFADISAGLTRQLSDSFYRAFDMSRASEKRMNDILEPLVKASNNAKKEVVKILEEGAKFKNADGTIGKEFTHSEIVARLPSGVSGKEAQQIVEGYISVRMMADASHAVMNKSMRESLTNEGYKHINVGSFEGIGTRLTDEAMLNIKAYYDPATDSVIEGLGKKDMQRIFDEGGQVYAVKGLQGKGASTSNYVVVKQGDTVDELPMQVMNYRDGYIPRIYKEQYFVTMRPKNAKINGESLSGDDVPTRVIGTASSKAGILRAIEKAKIDNPDMVIDYKHDRKLTADAIRSSEMDLKVNTSGLFYAKRGDHLPLDSGDLADTEDAVSSITRMAASVARRIELAPVIDMHKQRWLSAFGNYSNGKWPHSKEGIIDKAGKMTSSELESAKSYWNYINTQEAGGTTSEWWRNAMVKFGEHLEGLTKSESLGSVFRTTIADNDPLSLIRGATFITTIVANPFRQLFIQSQQVLYLAGLDPVGLPQSIGIGFNLVASKNLTPAAAKRLGMSLEELTEVRQAFKDSGIVEAVDSSLLGRDAMLSIKSDIANGAVEKMSQGFANGLRSTVNNVRAVGFDAGEIFNLGTTYAVAYRRWKKSNPDVVKLSEKDKYDIAADARQLALGMTQAGGFGYQKGGLSLATQFLSIQHKALLSIMPAFGKKIGKYGNQAITPKEARRIMGAQVLLYGASGIGMSSVVDKFLQETGTEVSPLARNIMMGGAYDSVVNAMLSSEVDSGGNLQFAQNLAAGSGWYDTILDKIGEVSDSPVQDLFMGPSTNLFSRFGYALGITGSALGASFHGEGGFELTMEDITDISDSWASIFSLYNNVQKGFAMNKVKSYVDKNLDALGGDASTKDAFIKAILGVGTYEEDSMYDHFNSVKKMKDNVEGIADLYYTRISRSAARARESGTFTSGEYLKLLRMNAKEKTYLELKYGTALAQQVFTKVGQMVRQRTDKGHGAFLEHAAHLAMLGGIDSESNAIVSNLVNGGQITPEEGKIIRRFIVEFNDRKE